MRKKLLALLLVISCLSASLVLAGGYGYKKHAHESEAMDMDMDMPNVVEIAVDNADFSTLVTALKAAGLDEALMGEGPYTVFAPTNDAFAKLPEGTVESLLMPENKEKLKKILLYHVYAGKVMSEDVSTMSVEMLSGDMASLDASDGVMIEGAKVIKADIEGKNGVIHVIDMVILPPEDE